MLIVLRSTRNVKYLLSLKDKSCVIYEGQCSCNLRYIRETKRNSEVRWKEHKDPGGRSEPAKHLTENASLKFTWKILWVVLLDIHRRKILEKHLTENASLKFTWKILWVVLLDIHRRKILEKFFIALRKPTLNDQAEQHSLSFFRHGVF